MSTRPPDDEAPDGTAAPSGGGASPATALGVAAIGYFAIVVAGFGMASLLTDTEVIAVPGLGQVPGAIGIGLGIVVFTVLLWLYVRQPRPGYGGAGVVTVATYLASVAGLWIGALVVGVDPARATSATGAFAVSWFAVILAAAAFVCAWCGIALVRTRAGRPHWPWEDDDQPEP